MSENQNVKKDIVPPDKAAIFDAFDQIESDFNTLLNRCRGIIVESKDIHETVEEIRGVVQNSPTGSDDFMSEAESLKRRIDIFSTEVEGLKSDLQKVESDLSQLTSIFVNSSEPHKNSIPIPLEADGDSSKEIAIPFDDISNFLHESYHSIDNKRSTLKNWISGLESDIDSYSEFNQLTKSNLPRVDVEINQLREERARFSEKREQINEVVKQLNSKEREIENEVQKSKEEFNSMFRNIENKIEDIEEAQREVDSLKETASNLVTNRSAEHLGGEFEERKREIRKSVIFWNVASILSILGLIISSAVIYQDIIAGDVGGSSSISAISLLLPISVAVWFSSSNYRQRKRLMNEYEFRSTVALSLISFRELLEEDISEVEEEVIGEFVVETMNMVYSNPQENVANQDSNGGGSPVTPSRRVFSELNNRIDK